MPGRAVLLLGTIASFRWGEVTALKRCDIDLDARQMHVRAAFPDRRTAGTRITLGPLKFRSARRTVGIPAVIVPRAPGSTRTRSIRATGGPEAWSRFRRSGQIHALPMAAVWQIAPHTDATDREAPGMFREHDIHPCESGMTPTR
jgi:integrase